MNGSTQGDIQRTGIFFQTAEEKLHPNQIYDGKEVSKDLYHP